MNVSSIRTQYAARTPWRQRVMALAFGSLLGASIGSAVAQQPPAAQRGDQQFITPNFKDVDLGNIVEAVSSVTGKTFVVSPQVRAQVTILSSTPMSPAAFYEAFLSILQVHGFAAVPSGNVVKIVPDSNIRAMPANDLPEQVSSGSDEIVTQVVSLKNVSAAQLLSSLRPLVAQNGHMAVHAAANMLIVTDRANNVSRILRIIQRIDQAGDDSIDVVPLENASAAEIVRVLNTLNTGAAQPDAAVLSAKVVSDDRTNSILITGEKSQRLRIRTLIAHLDTPRSGGETEVRYLRYADAEKLAGKLKEQVQGLVAAAGAAPAAGGGGAGAASADRSVSIWADVQNNALVITAPLKVRKQITAIVDKLDFRRAQVKVEAILVEMSFEKSSELGFNWIVGPGTDNDGIAPIGIFNQAVGGTTIGQIGAAALAVRQGRTTTGGTTTTTNANPALGSVASAIPSGVTIGGGRISDQGVNFVALLRALRGDGHTNIISTPSIITLDNEEAKIEVAQEVPFLTGQYSNSGTGGAGGQQGLVNPFQTIQRQKVGTILKITPQINEGDSVMLKIDQEASSLAQGTQGAVDLITNTRKFTTKVLVEDGGMIVIGGLVQDDLTEGENRVPILGSIPLIGELFKTRNVGKKKTNLMVFIHPTILRDGVQTAFETNAKYNAIRNEQMNYKNGKVTLLPGERQPALPPLEEKSRYSDPNSVPVDTKPTPEENANDVPIIDARPKVITQPDPAAQPETAPPAP
jgi:general secretion pathway protein D